ncbi:uncharacterized protein METZ01_LOCUS225173 [marine metagenome]|uniref:Uncharacterized protein n=1 Tax=marine metagenome TaxID=408172 RepID=A0A382GBM8_9ZZZZ
MAIMIFDHVLINTLFAKFSYNKN